MKTFKRKKINVVSCAKYNTVCAHYHTKKRRAARTKYLRKHKIPRYKNPKAKRPLRRRKAPTVDEMAAPWDYGTAGA